MSGSGDPRRRTVPTELAALAVGVAPATIRKWASRGRIHRYGRPGRAEYDLDELFALVGNAIADNPSDAARDRQETRQNGSRR